MKRMLLILMLASLLLAACIGGGPTPTLSPTLTTPVVVGEGVTLRFAVYDWERSRYEDLAEVFEEDNPGIRVQLVSLEETLGLTPDDFTWPEGAWLRLASAADVFNLPPDREAVRQGLLRDLRPFIEANASFQPDDFYPGTLTQYQWNGGTWGIPTAVNYRLIFYDKNAFDQAGLSYPEPGWTWDDFLATTRALTHREGDTVTRWGFVQPWPGHLQFIDNRVTLIDDSTDPPTPRFDQPDVTEAMRWYAALYLEHKVTPYFGQPGQSGQPLSPGEQLIEKGQAAMWHGNSASWQRHKDQNAQVELGAVPYPVDRPDSHTTPMLTEGLSMSAGTAQPNAAWRWIDFLSRQVLFGFEADGASQLLPARRSVAESSGFWKTVDVELADALRYAMDHSYVSAWQPGYDAFSEAIEAILKGDKPVEDALAEAQAQAKAEIQAALARQAQATPIPTLVVAGAEKETTSEDAVTISFIGRFNTAELSKPYRDLAKQFHQSHPDIIVEVKAPDFSPESDNLQTTAGDADCFKWSSQPHDLDALAAILNLDPFLEADASFSTDDFFPALLEQFTVQGQLWGLPAEAWPYVIEYNKDLFDAARVDYPKLDWMMDDFLAAAVALTKGEGETKQYGFVGEAYGSIEVLMLERLGAQLLDDSVDPPNVAFDDPATIEAVRWYADLITKYDVKPLFLSSSNRPDIQTLMSAMMEREALINDGRAAMWTKWGGHPDLSTNDRRKTMNIGVVPLPVGKGGIKSGSYLAISGYFISARTQARQAWACWQWITFLTGQPDAAQNLPARRSVAESDAYRQKVGAERAAAYLASVSNANAPFAVQLSAGEDSWLGPTTFWRERAFSQVVKGEASAEEALAAAQDLADDYRMCVIARDALSDPDTQHACLKEVDPTLPDFVVGGD